MSRQANASEEPFGFSPQGMTPQSRIQLTPASPGRLDLRIDGKKVFCDMVPEFALRVGVIAWKLSRRLAEHRASLSPTLGPRGHNEIGDWNALPQNQNQSPNQS